MVPHSGHTGKGGHLNQGPNAAHFPPNQPPKANERICAPGSDTIMKWNPAIPNSINILVWWEQACTLSNAELQIPFELRGQFSLNLRHRAVNVRWL